MFTHFPEQHSGLFKGHMLPHVPQLFISVTREKQNLNIGCRGSTPQQNWPPKQGKYGHG